MASNGVEVAKAFVTIVPTTKGAQDAITSAIVPAAGNAGKKAGASMGAATTGGLAAALKKFAVPAAVVAAIVGIGKVGLDAFAEVEKGANAVIKATGATGEKAKELTGVYKEVSRNVVGDFEDIGKAVGEINTRLGLNGDELETASEAMMKYAKVTGQDAATATKDVASMMRNAGIPTAELESTLGKLTVAGQAAGIDVSKLAQNTTKYNAVMKQLGLSTDEQIALMAKFEQSGADTSSILNAMKKGVASWAKEGKDAKTEFENFVKGVQDGSVTAGDAVEIFGSRGGLSMYEAAQKGQLSFEEMYDTISKANGENLDQVYKDTLTNSERMELAFNNIKLAAADIFAPLAEGISYLLDTVVVPAFQFISRSVEAFAQSPASAAIQQAISAISQAFMALWIALQPAFEFIKQRITELMPVFEDLATKFADIAAKVINFLSVILPPIIELVGGAITAFVVIIDGALNAIDFLLGAIGSVAAAIPQAWEKIKAATSSAWNAVKTTISNVWNGIKSTVSNAVNAVKNAIGRIGSVVGVVKNIFNNVKIAIQQPIQAARDFISNIIDQIKDLFSFDVHLPEIELPHINYDLIEVPILGMIPDPLTFSIDWYAKGGIFPANSPRIVGVGDASVPEAAAPLDQLGAMVDEYVTADNDEIVVLLKALVAKDSNVYLDGKELANSTVGYTDRALGSRQLTANRGVAQ